MSEPEETVADAPRQRLVAIVGRPNVGKSAIFNRLSGRALAIVHAESGVTRDRLMREVVWGEQRFSIVDTGGVCNMDGSELQDEIQAGIRRQVDIALEEAAVALFVTDIEKGAMPMDREVARLLHGRGCRVFLAANKADNREREAAAAEFEAFGFPVYPVSALHDRGFDSLMTEIVAALPPAGENPTVAKPLRVAIVGKPNVGKSSYINRLLRSERVIVSRQPGTTRDSVDAPFTIGSGPQARHYVLVDTAGIRHGRRPENAVESYGQVRAERSIAGADIVVLAIDAMQGPGLQDKKIGAMIMEQRRGCVLLVNKWDLSTVTEREYGPAIHRAMPFLGHCPVVFVSAQSGYNIRRSVEAIDLVASQVRAELPTGTLNRALSDAYERVQPPMVDGKRLKLFYGTQVGVSPVRIRIFVNDPHRVVPAYRDYLIRRLRENFGLEGAPVVLAFTGRRESDRDGERKNAIPARRERLTGRGRFR